MGDTLHYTDIELQNDDDVGYHFDDGAVEKSKQVELRRNKMKTIIVITRLFLAISIIIVVSVIGSTSYLLLKRIETRTFESQYDAIYEVIEIKVALEMGSLAYAGTSLAARYTSETSLNQQTGSQYLIEKNGFETEYTKLQLLTVARAISFNPMIDPSNAAAWESWASSKINSNPSLNYYDTSNLVNGSPKIYKRVNGVVVATSQNTDCSTIPTHNVYFPVWQIAPIATNTKAIMFDLHSELNRCRALNDLIDNKKAAITDIIQLVQDTSTRPSSIYFEPVIISNNIVGTVSIVFSWDSVFQDMIPNDINSLYLVLSSPTLTFTWIISNGVVSLIGKGDFHDTDYNHYKKTVIVDVSTMHFELNIYPSEKYSKSFYTSEPQRFTIAIVLVIAFIAVLFIVLDYLQSKNSGKLEKEATFKGGIIDQLFPSTVQDKLFKSAPSKVTRRSSGCAGCGTTNQSSSRLSSYLEVSMKSSLGGLCAGNSKKEVILQDSDPIADSYENSTVLFADLVGFTYWSENRSPTEVFKLLEGLFSAFDKRARIHKVFKVETIGIIIGRILIIIIINTNNEYLFRRLLHGSNRCS